MKIVVIGGTGLIGSKTIVLLRGAGHDALAAAPNTGVNTVTGEGLEAALDAAEVVVDLANSPSFEPSAVMGFFTAHEQNLLAAEARAGVRHHVALSIVGADRSPDSGYFRAKIVQEDLIKASGIPYTIIRSTQFMEFLGAIADAGQGTASSASRPACFSRLPQMTSPPSWPRWRYLRRAVEQSKSPDRRGHPSMRSSRDIWR
jgi:uncharacterized protein YbjT (DUF2867 family)